MNQKQGLPAEQRGTIRDWPAAVIVIALLIALFVTLGGHRPTVVVWAMLAFGVVALLIRRGAFRSRP